MNSTMPIINITYRKKAIENLSCFFEIGVCGAVPILAGLQDKLSMSGSLLEGSQPDLLNDLAIPIPKQGMKVVEDC